ncbi:hypothetical protein ABES25_18905 [Bacillus gobiensis]|uniref:hypothetical protein n=1 Tax=Bacillus gobiensis TaxID=1441095 RepID=UPI003D24053E
MEIILFIVSLAAFVSSIICFGYNIVVNGAREVFNTKNKLVKASIALFLVYAVTFVFFLLLWN